MIPISRGLKAEQWLLQILKIDGFLMTSTQYLDKPQSDREIMISTVFQDIELKVDLWIRHIDYSNGEWIPIQLTVSDYPETLEYKKIQLENLGYKVVFLKLDYMQLKRAINPHPHSTPERRKLSRNRIIKRVFKAIEEQIDQGPLLSIDHALFLEELYKLEYISLPHC